MRVCDFRGSERLECGRHSQVERLCTSLSSETAIHLFSGCCMHYTMMEHADTQLTAPLSPLIHCRHTREVSVNVQRKRLRVRCSVRADDTERCLKGLSANVLVGLFCLVLFSRWHDLLLPCFPQIAVLGIVAAQFIAPAASCRATNHLLAAAPPNSSPNALGSSFIADEQ